MKVLVVGQGYSGSLLGFLLIQRGVEVLVADNQFPMSATLASAGILNPITGKRLSLSYRATEFLPFAIETYNWISEETGFAVFQPKPVLHVFNSPANRNDWFARSADDDFREYCGAMLSTEEVHDSLIAPFGAIVVKPSGWVHAAGMRAAVRQWLIMKKSYLTATVSPEELQVKPGSISWQGRHFDYVVFCEGYQPNNAGLFSHLPFNPSKGEIIDFQAKGLDEEHVVINGIYVLPVSPGNFRAGSTYNWDDLNPTPTEAGALELTEALAKIITVPFSITSHKAAIRPAITDRRPVIGMHPELPRVAILNGLGTKASILAPVCASMMCDLLLKNIQPDPFMDVKRFASRYHQTH